MFTLRNSAANCNRARNMIKHSLLPTELPVREASKIYLSRFAIFTSIALLAFASLVLPISFHATNIWGIVLSIIPLSSILIAFLKYTRYQLYTDEIYIEADFENEVATQSPLMPKKTGYTVKIVGVGGAGQNILNRMIEKNTHGVEYLAVNTDAKSLSSSKAPKKLLIGQRLTNSLSTGGVPEIGQKAAEESSNELYIALKGADMVIITAGMGGGTGTGAASIIARISKEIGALTIGLVSIPFKFEGGKREQVSYLGLEKMREYVDFFICFPNDILLQMIGKKSTLKDAFDLSDYMLSEGAKSISELLTITGLINFEIGDFAEIKQKGSFAFMSFGYGQGSERVQIATEQALTSPLLSANIATAQSILFIVRGGKDLSLFEVNQILITIKNATQPNVIITFGAIIDEDLKDEIKVAIVANGFNSLSSNLQSNRKNSDKTLQDSTLIENVERRNIG